MAIVCAVTHRRIIRQRHLPRVVVSRLHSLVHRNVIIFIVVIAINVNHGNWTRCYITKCCDNRTT